MRPLLFIIILWACTALPGRAIAIQKPTDCSKLSGVSKVVCLAENFKATLTKEQLALVQLSYSKGDAVRWSNFPQAFARPSRVGLSLGSLNEDQLRAFNALMSEVLSHDQPNEGFDELQGELAADSYFGKKTGKTGTFGSNYYVIVFLGTPSTTGLWELMFGGHHYAFANTYNKGRLAGATPSFRGVEPNEPVANGTLTYLPLETERKTFADLIQSLNDGQKKSARLESSMNDVLLGPGEDDGFPTGKQGIRIGDLSKDQQLIVIKAISLYVNDLDAVSAQPIMKRYTDALNDTYLVYSGSGSMNEANDYVRLDGPDVWIEFSAQPSRDFPGTTHPHSVWRDHKTDYGSN